MKKKVKKTNKKKKLNKSRRIVVVSGGFDPIHIGHIRYIQEASQLGDELIVILNNDNWLIDKKGYVFMPQHERVEVLMSIRGVDRVIPTDHGHGEYFKDRSVCRTLEQVHPHVFANGGDRKPDGDPVPEVALCEKLGIKCVYNVGTGGKVQSSSWLVNKLKENKIKVKKT